MNSAQHRRLVLQGFLTVAASGASLALPGQAIGQAKPKVSSLRSTSRSWLWSAEDFAMHRQLFDRSGLTVELAATNRGVNQDALLSGAADILLGSPATNMRIQAQGHPKWLWSAGQRTGLHHAHIGQLHQRVWLQLHQFDGYFGELWRFV